MYSSQDCLQGSGAGISVSVVLTHGSNYTKKKRRFDLRNERTEEKGIRVYRQYRACLDPEPVTSLGEQEGRRNVLVRRGRGAGWMYLFPLYR